MARTTRWSGAVRLTGRVSADWGVSEDPDACAVEVLFVDERGLSYVVFAVGPSVPAALATAEEEAREHLGCASGHGLARRVVGEGGAWQARRRGTAA